MRRLQRPVFTGQCVTNSYATSSLSTISSTSLSSSSFSLLLHMSSGSLANRGSMARSRNWLSAIWMTGVPSEVSTSCQSSGTVISSWMVTLSFFMRFLVG